MPLVAKKKKCYCFRKITKKCRNAENITCSLQDPNNLVNKIMVIYFLKRYVIDFMQDFVPSEYNYTTIKIINI